MKRESLKTGNEGANLSHSSLESTKGREEVRRLARKRIRAAVRASKQLPANGDLVRDEILVRLQKRLSRIGGKLRLVADFPEGPSVTMTLRGRIVSISEE